MSDVEPPADPPAVLIAATGIEAPAPTVGELLIEEVGLVASGDVTNPTAVAFLREVAAWDHLSPADFKAVTQLIDERDAARTEIARRVSEAADRREYDIATTMSVLGITREEATRWVAAPLERQGWCMECMSLILNAGGWGGEDEGPIWVHVETRLDDDHDVVTREMELDAALEQRDAARATAASLEAELAALRAFVKRRSAEVAGDPDFDETDYGREYAYAEVLNRMDEYPHERGEGESDVQP